MAKKKKCPYCKGYHYKMRAYRRCKNAHTGLSWGK